ncbi:GNAT family N-acetyltransferase [Comamonas suwonensis]|uniref:GNAT family N-acetyltransferase n=1 Tax=Comamonas suwonensis TaxID=2606214 RepID=UPI001F3AB7B9|nr:GNAT family N-acetyltransferase [Comamonas suwonensis]
MMVTIRKTSDRVPGFEELAWDIFFQSKSRGISLVRHFPWILEPLDKGFYILAEIKARVVGGLVVKNWRGLIDGHDVKVGMIGLVCVSFDFRGQGISRMLLEAALSEARVDSFDALTLWTNSPALYAQYGFFGADAWQYGWVHKKERVDEKEDIFLVDFNIAEIQGKAIPPFAQSINELKGKISSVFLIKDGNGWIVAGYKGDVKEAAYLMARNLVNSWRLNIEKDDPLKGELERLGYEINVDLVNLQMWHTIDLKLRVSDLVNKIKIPVLERI